MAIDNPLLQLLGIRLPIIQAPMAGISSPAMAAAQVKGRERNDSIVEARGRRPARGHKLADKVSRDVDAVVPESEAEPR
jgi:NAD(P)H-dependent flavin oxidoreductase YrpB (nitropropane dioxygenase family)